MIAKLLGRTPPVAGKDFLLPDSGRIGAAPDADVRIRAEGVSRVHAQIWREGDTYWLEDKGSTNGTFVSGSRITRDRLRHLDVVTLGRAVDLIFVCQTGEGPAAESKPRGVVSATLEWIDGPEAGTCIDVPPGEITLGRSTACNVIVNSAAVSKIHLRLQRTPDQVWIEDLGSANGTFVNGKRIDGRVLLSNRSQIGLAGVRNLRLALTRDPAAGDAESTDTFSETSQIFDQEWKTRAATEGRAQTAGRGRADDADTRARRRGGDPGADTGACRRGHDPAADRSQVAPTVELIRA